MKMQSTWWAAMVVTACAQGATEAPFGPAATGTSPGSGGTGGASVAVGVGGFDPQGSGGSGGGEGLCVAPDMLIALDRTLTMGRTPEGTKPADPPEYASSKWHQAISAIEQVVAPPLDQTIRFGLQLWPRDPGGGVCNSLTQQVAGTKSATNVWCEAGDLTVHPALGAAEAVDSALDPHGTNLCYSTPTGQALVQAGAFFSQTKEPGREQFIMLVTDGADWDQTCPTPDPLATVQALAAVGVRTYVVGFFDPTSNGGSGSVGEAFLNDMACAGRTAPDFPNPCTDLGGGNYVAKGTDKLFHAASNAADLVTALDGIASDVCCDCVD